METVKLLRESVFPLTRKNEEVKEDVPFIMSVAPLFVTIGLSESLPVCVDCAVNMRSFSVTPMVGASL